MLCLLGVLPPWHPSQHALMRDATFRGLVLLLIWDEQEISHITENRKIRLHESHSLPSSSVLSSL